MDREVFRVAYPVLLYLILFYRAEAIATWLYPLPFLPAVEDAAVAGTPRTLLAPFRLTARPTAVEGAAVAGTFRLLLAPIIATHFPEYPTIPFHLFALPHVAVSLDVLLLPRLLLLLLCLLLLLLLLLLCNLRLRWFAASRSTDREMRLLVSLLLQMGQTPICHQIEMQNYLSRLRPRQLAPLQELHDLTHNGAVDALFEQMPDRINEQCFGRNEVFELLKFLLELIG